MKSFNEIYEEIYKNNNEDLENLRKSRAKKAIILITIAIVGIVLIMINAMNSMSFFAIWYLVIGVMLIVIISAVTKGKYTAIFKQKVIEPFIKNIDENLSYNPTRGIASVLYRRGEFEYFDKYSSEDGIEGILDGKYEIRMAEVHTQNESRDSDGNTHTYTVFHGIFGNIACSKNIGTELKIHSDKGMLGNLFKGKAKLEMDSSEFEQHFDVYAEDKIVAMQILTSDIMDMMIQFREESKIKYELTIKENEIYIRFHTGEVFEPKMFTKSLDYDMLKRYYDIIDFIFKVSIKINKVIENTEI